MTRDVDFEIGAEISPLKKSLREAAESVKQFAREGEAGISGMTGPLGVLQEKFVMIGAVLAGGEVFRAAVEMTANFTKESINLGRALGISTTEASNYIAALEDVDVSQEEFVGAAKALSKELKNNEGALQAMGLKTRDAAGNLRPLNELTVEGIEILNGYKEGTDRAVAATVLFGKKFELTSNLIELNTQTVRDNAELQRALAAIVGQESVEAWGAFDSAGDKAALTLKAVQVAIGNALLPVLTDLANWFVAVGPAAITVVRGALGGLVAAFHLVTTGVTVLWETINAMVVTVAEPIRGLVSAIGRAMAGDFAGAGAAIMGIGTNISNAWGQAFDVMAGKAQATRDRIWNLFATPTDSAPASGEGKSAASLVKPEKEAKGKKEADPSYMAYYEAALAERKRFASEEDALREYTKAEELAYWQSLLDAARLHSKDRLAIEKKVSDLTVQVRREEAKEAQALDAEGLRHKQEMAILAIDAEKAAAQAAFDAEQLTQVQLLDLQGQFEDRKYEIQKQALIDKLNLMAADPSTSPAERERLQNAITELEQQHRVRGITLLGQKILAEKKAAADSLQIWKNLGDRMSGLWDKGIQAMMNGTLTWRNAFRAVGSEMVGWFANNVVGGMLKNWIAGEVKKLAMKLGFLAQEKTAQTVASAEVVGVKTTEATTVTGANAVEAGTGAAAALASIPYVGPVLAMAAMASVFAAVSAMGGRMKSAAKGYDIPKGLNPLVQTHEEEMILPAEHANTIRSLAELARSGNLGGSGEPSNVVNYHDHSGKLSDSEIMRKAHVIAREMSRMARNGYWVGKK